MICALLAYYDEHPTWLRQMVNTLPLAGVEALVAADGAYALYPNARAKSRQDGAEALRQACAATGIDLHLHIPDEVWRDEMHKRSFLFEMAEDVTAETDWYFVVDADELVTECPPNLPDVLAGTPELAAEAVLYEPGESEIPMRMFFRALRGLRVVNNHYTYELPDGRRLWGDWSNQLEPAATLPVRVEHRDKKRPASRVAAKFAYYDRRDKEAPEQHVCHWCDSPATRSVPWNWRWSGPGIVGDRTGVCDDCAPAKFRETVQAAADLGVDATHLLKGQRAFR